VSEKKSTGKTAQRREWENRRARFEVAVEQTLTAGLVLTGDEIKSIRAQRVQLTGSFVKFLGAGKRENPQGVPVVVGLHLGAALQPDRSRPLLLQRKELRELAAALQAKGKTAVPLRLFFQNGWAKMDIGIGSGRKLYQKRELLRERDLDRERAATLKHYR
jgi:SsrA-binding protein